MAKEQPPDDASASIEGSDHLSAEGVQRPPEDRSLSSVTGRRQVSAIDQVGVKLEPADKGIAISIFQFLGFRKAAQSRPKAVNVALADLRKNSYPGDASGVRHAFNHTGQQ